MFWLHINYFFYHQLFQKRSSTKCGVLLALSGQNQESSKISLIFACLQMEVVSARVAAQASTRASADGWWTHAAMSAATPASSSPNPAPSASQVRQI